MYKKIIAVLVCFALLTIVVSACRIIDASTIPKNPAVQMGQANFLQSTITLKKGQSLDLVDTVNSTHVIKNGSWNGGQQQPATEPNAPTVNFTVNSAGQRQTIGPFAAAGTFHIYCTVHQGMNLAITVS
jgi:plastocyanin